MDAWDEWYLDAFYELNTARLVTDSGANPISWRDIVDFAELHGLEHDTFQVFRVVIRELDASFLKDWQEQAQKKPPKPPPP